MGERDRGSGKGEEGDRFGCKYVHGHPEEWGRGRGWRCGSEEREEYGSVSPSHYQHQRWMSFAYSAVAAVQRDIQLETAGAAVNADAWDGDGAGSWGERDGRAAKFTCPTLRGLAVRHEWRRRPRYLAALGRDKAHRGCCGNHRGQGGEMNPSADPPIRVSYLRARFAVLERRYNYRKGYNQWNGVDYKCLRRQELREEGRDELGARQLLLRRDGREQCVIPRERGKWYERVALKGICGVAQELTVNQSDFRLQLERRACEFNGGGLGCSRLRRLLLDGTKLEFRKRLTPEQKSGMENDIARIPTSPANDFTVTGYDPPQNAYPKPRSPVKLRQPPYPCLEVDPGLGLGCSDQLSPIAHSTSDPVMQANVVLDRRPGIQRIDQDSLLRILQLSTSLEHDTRIEGIQGELPRGYLGLVSRSLDRFIVNEPSLWTTFVIRPDSPVETYTVESDPTSNFLTRSGSLPLSIYLIPGTLGYGADRRMKREAAAARFLGEIIAMEGARIKTLVVSTRWRSSLMRIGNLLDPQSLPAVERLVIESSIDDVGAPDIGFVIHLDGPERLTSLSIDAVNLFAFLVSTHDPHNVLALITSLTLTNMHPGTYGFPEDGLSSIIKLIDSLLTTWEYSALFIVNPGPLPSYTI
ncbi:hypothetical protein DFP72DRAFT_1048995 [Ephemerocybe angulata]|uniref:Uncharacterized protein n=1 Tax=Ephemerocybe angulata TaxID=980116 RepID=A0A8H6M1V7_9AGAR|nr:hypothetical protein DFP72DRAFT_1048995 [Tulosesus angulatus]